MADQGEVSRHVLTEFGIKLVGENPPGDNPGNLVVSALLCYRSDPRFWDEHLRNALAEPEGRSIEVEQANIDQLMADWRRAVEEAQREIQAKG